MVSGHTVVPLPKASLPSSKEQIIDVHDMGEPQNHSAEGEKPDPK